MLIIDELVCFLLNQAGLERMFANGEKLGLKLIKFWGGWISFANLNWMFEPHVASDTEKS